MTPLLAYLVKVIICSGILYAYYHLALRNNRFHQWNRFYLLLCTILSLVVPLLKIPLPLAAAETDSLFVYTSQVVTLREQVFTPVKTLPVVHFDWAALLYGSVIVVLFGRILYGYWKIMRLIHHSRVEFIKPYWLVLSEHITSPFSFFRYIFWNNRVNATTQEGRQMLQHEMVHMQEKHSTDKLFMEIITAVCWINPFFHLIKRELSLIHEFIADKKAVVNGEVADYAQTILQMALQSNHQFSMTNNFAYQPIKRRILMLTQSPKLRFSYLRRLMILPIAIMIFCSLAFVVTEKNIDDIGKTFAAPLITEKQVQQKPVPLPPPPPKPAAKIVKVTQQEEPNEPPNEIFTFVEHPPTFPGGDDALNRYLAKNIRYPALAAKNNLFGTIFVSFVVDDKGAIKNVKTVGAKKGGGLEEEATRVVKAMPNWKPGKQNGRFVSVQFNLPIRFSLANDGNDNDGKLPVRKIAPDGTYLVVDQMPAFAGGEDAMHKFIAQNVKYPRAATEKGISGTVYLKFDINTDGSISDVKPLNTTLGGGLVEEAVRVVKLMPKWNPGKQKGENVRVRYVLPVNFVLQK